MANFSINLCICVNDVKQSFIKNLFHIIDTYTGKLLVVNSRS